jgi:esterase
MNLSYREYGEPTDDFPIIVLHGLFGSKESWHTQASWLSEHHHVITVDVRNHGQSPHIAGMSYQEMAQDVLELIDTLGFPQVKLLGHSMGGKVCMMLALEHPERVERLLVVDIAPKKYPLHHQKLIAGMLYFPLYKLQSREQAGEWMAKLADDPLEQSFLLKNLKRAQDKSFYWQLNLEEISRQYLKIAGFPVQPEKRYAGDVCFIRGGCSHYIKADDEPLLIQHFPNHQLITVDGTGHIPHVEKMEAFFAHASRFFA